MKASLHKVQNFMYVHVRVLIMTGILKCRRDSFSNTSLSMVLYATYMEVIGNPTEQSVLSSDWSSPLIIDSLHPDTSHVLVHECRRHLYVFKCMIQYIYIQLNILYRCMFLLIKDSKEFRDLLHYRNNVCHVHAMCIGKSYCRCLCIENLLSAVDQGSQHCQ